MGWMKKMAVVGLLGFAGALAGCEDRRGPAEEVGQDIDNTVEDTREGVGGSGDVNIGDEPGVIDDGEGPLEDPETRPGDEPGIIHDGEGPIEENRQ